MITHAAMGCVVMPRCAEIRRDWSSAEGLCGEEEMVSAACRCCVLTREEEGVFLF